ncbi:ATP-binding cassette domain-containing protein [Oceanispirochaeta sp.]|jgi:excisionase family DNA binding protein|uniref:ATP-binding cassette domain-containing protein n=1 Tax=Oceanispirochaeta sp. TaxID=2035350 RepID=UPI00261B79C6|nr:ATP-binding cassette domain-containing protein [Oceanispirochaeta sp.]MDA3957948.1 ATP-binding cassette domain-containing protein [Oceanispirochaeta sp.]
MTHKDKTLTIKEVAEFLNISNQMVYNLIRDRKIEAFKVGSTIRILDSDLFAYIEQQKLDFHGSDEALENSDENLFVVKKLNFRREEFQLQDISFQIPRGKILTILGPSGSGKTMLLKALAGINQNDSGAVFLGTKRMDTLPASERNIGFVFEDYALMNHRSGRGNIRFPLEVMKTKTIKKEEIDPAVEAMARELNISRADLDRLISVLPEGIKQLIAIARADIRNIDILMMDEPLTHLDTKNRLQMRTFLKGLVTGLGKTTIISLHDPETALALSDYLAVLDKGRLIQFGTARELYNAPAHKIVLEMTSRFAVSKLDVSVKDGHLNLFPYESDKKDGDYQLLIRADEITLCESSSGIRARIKDRHPLDGSRILADCSSDSGDLELILPTETDEEFSFRPKSIHLF